MELIPGHQESKARIACLLALDGGLKFDAVLLQEPNKANEPSHGDNAISLTS